MSVTTPMSGPDRDTIEALPPAPTAVVRALQETDRSGLTTEQLTDHTVLKEGTVRSAVERLSADGLVEKSWSGSDGRRRVYQLADEEVEHVE